MSEKKKPKYEMHSPEAKALIDEIVHGTFTKEGTMAAFPTCFPGASIPIPGDESHITALDISANGMIYGSTEMSTDEIPILDPVRNVATVAKIPVRDPKTPSSVTDAMAP